MTIAALELFNAYCLTVHADDIIDGAYLGLGTVFWGIAMGDDARIPEDGQKLKKWSQSWWGRSL